MKGLIFPIVLSCVFIYNSAFAQWDKYPTYDEYVNYMNTFQEDYPELCKVVEFGTSVQDRKLLAAKISDNINEEEKEPGFFYLSTIHGNEVVGYMLMLHLINYLLSNYEKDTLVTTLVNAVEIWINPLGNPDGTYRGGNSNIQGAVRYNANNADLKRNFPRLPGAGTSQDPEKETEAIMGLAETHHFVMSADLHAGTEAAILLSDHKAQ